MQDSIVSFRTKSIVNLREGSNAISKVIIPLEKNEELIVVDSIGNWVSVIVPDKKLKGFINKNIFKEVLNTLMLLNMKIYGIQKKRFI